MKPAPTAGRPQIVNLFLAQGIQTDSTVFIYVLITVLQLSLYICTYVLSFFSIIFCSLFPLPSLLNDLLL